MNELAVTMDNLKILNGEQMMSHEQISKVTGKRVDNVKRKMDSLVQGLHITVTQIEELYPISNGGHQTKKVYYVNERDSHIVVAQLYPELCAKLVDDWIKLKFANVSTEELNLRRILTQIFETIYIRLSCLLSP